MHSNTRSFGVETEFGFIPSFTCRSTGATHRRFVDAVAAAGKVTLDYPALNVFLRSGLFLNGATPFNEIRRNSPPPVIVPAREISREAAIDAYIELFGQAVTRRVRPDSVVALSGGRDSRHILLELHAQRNLPQQAVTVAIPGRAAEVEVAKALAHRAGIQHKVVEPPPDNAAEDEAWKNIHTDFMAMEHRWFSCAARSVRDLAWWDGIGGDVLSAGLFLEPWNLAHFQNGDLDRFADKLCYEPLEVIWGQRELFPRAAAVDALRTELARHKDAANPVGSFYFWNRTRITIGASAFGLLGAYNQPTLAPYLDRDLWSLLASLPVDLLMDKQLHTQAILKAYPQFADVPFYEGPGTRYPDILRRHGWSLLAFLRSRPRFWKAGILARVVRALASNTHLGGIDSLLSDIVYAAQLQALRGNGKIA